MRKRNTSRSATDEIGPSRPGAGPHTDEEIVAAALSDPDNPPMKAEDFARMKRVPRAKTLRRALHLSQEEFADRYHIPLGTLRDWEQGRTEPDAAARTYLHVIAAAPEVVRTILADRRAETEAALRQLQEPR